MRLAPFVVVVVVSLATLCISVLSCDVYLAVSQFPCC